jgi:hypothetical protein
LVTGKKVLISPRWIDRVSWNDSKVHVSLSREAIKNAPEYHPDTLNRQYEQKLYHHYGDSSQGNQPAEPTISDQEVRRRIAKKAYELYERRGRVPGREVEDWLEAERMVMAELNPDYARQLMHRFASSRVTERD